MVGEGVGPLPGPALAAVHDLDDVALHVEHGVLAAAVDEEVDGVVGRRHQAYVVAGRLVRPPALVTLVSTGEALNGGMSGVHLRAARYGGHPSPDGDVSSLGLAAMRLRAVHERRLACHP